jgi:hypothetical protein
MQNEAERADRNRTSEKQAEAAQDDTNGRRV